MTLGGYSRPTLTLPYSNYLFAEGFYRTDEQAWIDAHAHMFSFFGGATPVLVPDNCKTAVSKNTKEADRKSVV